MSSGVLDKDVALATFCCRLSVWMTTVNQEARNFWPKIFWLGTRPELGGFLRSFCLFGDARNLEMCRKFALGFSNSNLVAKKALRRCLVDEIKFGWCSFLVRLVGLPLGYHNFARANELALMLGRFISLSVWQGNNTRLRVKMNTRKCLKSSFFLSQDPYTLLV